VLCEPVSKKPRRRTEGPCTDSRMVRAKENGSLRGIGSISNWVSVYENSGRGRPEKAGGHLREGGNRSQKNTEIGELSRGKSVVGCGAAFLRKGFLRGVGRRIIPGAGEGTPPFRGGLDRSNAILQPQKKLTPAREKRGRKRQKSRMERKKPTCFCTRKSTIQPSEKVRKRGLSNPTIQKKARPERSGTVSYMEKGRGKHRHAGKERNLNALSEGKKTMHGLPIKEKREQCVGNITNYPPEKT